MRSGRSIMIMAMPQFHSVRADLKPTHGEARVIESWH
jgi:hypothetical protein